jgi:XTP/dITP diphosphohydrolase
MRVFLASSNPGKLREFRELAAGSPLEIELLPDFQKIELFEESAPTFAENSAGKALHYSRFSSETILADDSGLVVPALGGAPGVHSARYAGPNATAAERIAKLLQEMEGQEGSDRLARFVCVIVLARRGRVIAVTSDFAEGVLAKEPRGENGFGYDPIFCPNGSGRTWAEIPAHEKNVQSHRGKAFNKAAKLLLDPSSLSLW